MPPAENRMRRTVSPYLQQPLRTLEEVLRTRGPDKRLSDEDCDSAGRRPRRSEEPPKKDRDGA